MSKCNSGLKGASVSGKFTQDSVGPKNDNGRLGVKRGLYQALFSWW